MIKINDGFQNPHLHSVMHNGNGGLSNGGRPPTTEQAGPTVREYLAIVRRHLGLVLGLALVCGAVAAYKAYTDPSVYSSSALIRLSDPRAALAGDIAGAALGGRLGGDPILSQIEILKSRTVLGTVVDEVGLRLTPLAPGFPRSVLQDVQIGEVIEDAAFEARFDEAGVEVIANGRSTRAAYGEPIELRGVRFVVASDPGVDEEQFVISSRDGAAAGLGASLTADPRDRTDVVEIGYSAYDPITSQAVVNAVIERFRGYNADAARQEARSRRVFLESRLSYTDSLLREAQVRLTTFRERESVLSSRERFAAQQAGLMELEREREMLTGNLQTYRTLLGGLQRGGNSRSTLQALLAAPGLSSNLLISQLSDQLLEYQTRRDTVTSGEFASAVTNPDVERLDQLIVSTQTRLVDAVRSHISTVEANVGTLNAIRQQRLAEISTAPGTEAEEVRLQAEVEQIGAVAAELRQEHQRAQMFEAVEAGQVEILDPALPGVTSVGHRIRTLLFGVALGLLLGGGSAVLLERMNTSIRRKDEIERLLQIPELGMIPRLAPAAEGQKARTPLNRIPMLNGRVAALKEGTELVASSNPQSPGAEAYRTLRTNLIFSQTVQGLRSMVITSSAPSEGKSTTAANLAVTFAQQGLKVLLVDCDLRKARLHRVFGVPREPGFTQVALGFLTPEQVIRPTAIENLSIVAGGTLPPNPAELLGAPNMRATLDALSEGFDLMILDAPPLLAAPDAAILGTLSDGVLLVVRAAHTEREAAQQAVQKLAAVGARILGAVLNDPSGRLSQDSGYYAYEYYGAEK